MEIDNDRWLRGLFVVLVILLPIVACEMFGTRAMWIVAYLGFALWVCAGIEHGGHRG